MLSLLQNLPTVELAGARTVWLASSDAVNRQLYCGYRQASGGGIEAASGCQGGWGTLGA